MNRARVCVVKVGGSLLATPILVTRIREWLHAERLVDGRTHFVLIVGGGKLVDTVREIDRCIPLGNETAHWICIELLDVTSRLLAARLPEMELVDDFAILESRLRSPGITLFRPSQFMKQIEPHRAGKRLARDWSVTSDSIAGRLAVVLAADELVLLKSAGPPSQRGTVAPLRWLASVGYVDSFLSTLAPELPDLRFMEISSSPAGRGVTRNESGSQQSL